MSRTILVAHPSAELYGSDRVLLESVVGLCDNGFDVVVTLPAGGPLVARLEAAGACVVTVATPVLRKAYLSPTGLPRLAAASLRAVVPSLRLLRGTRPAVLLVNTITIPLWLPLARLLRIPVVCHVHEAEGSASRAVRALLAAPLLLAHWIVCNSRFSESVLVGSWPWLALRTEVVPNGVAGPASPPAPRERLDGPIRLLYLGRLSERKGVDVAVDALHRLRERGVPARLDVVGAVFDGYEWYEEALRRQARDLGLGTDLTLHGFVDDVWEHLAAADVLLVPSRADEPFGNTAVEGLLAARPVVASATSGLLEGTEGMRAARTVPPGDPDALAAAVVDLAGDWPRVREDVLADCERANALYSPATYRRRIAEVVTSIAQRHGRLPAGTPTAEVPGG